MMASSASIVGFALGRASSMWLMYACVQPVCSAASRSVHPRFARSRFTSEASLDRSIYQR